MGHFLAGISTATVKKRISRIEYVSFSVEDCLRTSREAFDMFRNPPYRCWMIPEREIGVITGNLLSQNLRFIARINPSY